MPSYNITSPEGKKFRVTAPDGASKEEVLSYAQKHFGSQEAAPEAPTPNQPDKSSFEKGTEAIASTADKLTKPAGLIGRGIIQGGAWPFATIANLPAAASNKMLGTKFPEQNQLVSDTLTKIGVPKAEGAGENILTDVSGALTGTGAGIKGAEAIAKTAKSPLAKKIAGILAANPKSQIASTATGATAGSGVKEMGGGPIAQLLATLAGGMTPAAVAEGLPKAFKSLFTGKKSPADIQKTIDEFAQIGAKPSAGQATENPLVRSIEAVVGKSPGGVAPIKEKAIQQQEALKNKVDDIATGLSPKASGEIAGRKIEKGIEEGIAAKKETQAGLYEQFDNLLPKGTEVTVDNTTKILNELTNPVPGMKSTSATLANPKIQEIKTALERDMFGDVKKYEDELRKSGFTEPVIQKLLSQLKVETKPVSYDALKRIRSQVGGMIESSSFGSDVPTGELKRLYGALSDDMKIAAKATGPEAEKALTRANKYTKAMHERIDTVQRVVDKNGGPEKVFQAATSGTAEGATTLRAVLKTLPDDAKKTLVSTMLRRLGRATPGRQNDIGTEFSTETFLTNWNRLSPEAKSAMSGPMGKQYAEDLNKVAKVASNLREGSKVYSNPSGTAPLKAAIVTYGALGTGIGTGNLPGIAGALSYLASNRGAAKLLTNPEFVNWLAKAPKPNSKDWGAYATRLTAISQMYPEDSEAIADVQNKMSQPKTMNTKPPSFFKQAIPGVMGAFQ